MTTTSTILFTLVLLGGVTGTLKHHAQMTSKHVDARNVDVWLPPGYSTNPAARYPVLYMHDGQNLFDPDLSYIKGVDWGVDEAMTRLIAEGAIKEAIVVGVWNTPKRVAEYTPQHAEANAYLKFLVTELKPTIDTTYRTMPGRASTFVMGSSMGGLISLYAMAEYPDVFGGAGCVSTHWPAGNGFVIDHYSTKGLPDPATHRIYFDYGTATLDAQYEPFQKRMDEVVRKAGYVEGENWITRKFEGAEHSERSWRERVDVPLRFLLTR